MRRGRRSWGASSLRVSRPPSIVRDDPTQPRRKRALADPGVTCPAMTEHLTMMAVHAHPDDEAASTGGILARYAREGIRTVVVTCTNGELGDGSGGLKPHNEGHDEAAVVATRREELRAAC